MNRARIEELAVAIEVLCDPALNEQQLGNIRAALTTLARECFEEAAKLIDPNRKPCDCVVMTSPGHYYEDCSCGNSGDFAEAAAWCVRKNDAAAIRTLKEGL